MAPLPNSFLKEVSLQEPRSFDAAPVNPSISAAIKSHYEALKNDVQQAHELAADFQRQLAGKSNDFALLRQVFEKAREDLGSLQADITALREERHHLANEAMKGAAFQMKLRHVTAERDRLATELEVMRNALTSSVEEMTRCVHYRDKQIAELTVEIAILKQSAPAKIVEASVGPSIPREPKTAAAERIHESHGVDELRIDFS